MCSSKATARVSLGCPVEAREHDVRYYEDGDYCPFREWMGALTDGRVMAAIDARIARFRTGNFGDSKSIGEGASESGIDLGPGYRIYYGVDGDDIILLNGGHKASQTADIRDALSYWKSYKERKGRERKQT
jgi:putative addiction module killer protein